MPVALFGAISAWLSKNGATADDLARHLGERSGESLKVRVSASMYELALVLDAAAEIIGDDCLAVRIAANLDPRDFGVLGYLGLASRTLGEALHNLVRYHAVTKGPARYEIETTADAVHIFRHVSDPRLIAHRHTNELVAAILVRCYRFFTGLAIRPIEVRFVHVRRSQVREIAEFFGGRTVFGDRSNVIILRSGDMAAPIPSADSRLLKVLRGYCEEIIGSSRKKPVNLRERVEIALAASLAKGETKIEHIAREIGVSSRTLSRRLSDLGTSYIDILDNLRRGLAARYVSSDDITLADAAFLLGYSEVSAFNHAFKRWTGKSPKAFREK
jgi:AraC-like DNA-binding protein